MNEPVLQIRNRPTRDRSSEDVVREQAGGGLYGEAFDDRDEPRDFRCAERHDVYCSNTVEQNQIIQQLIENLEPAFTDSLTTLSATNSNVQPLKDEQLDAIAQIWKTGTFKNILRDSRIGGLIEFSRAVHAEMDALLAAARKGSSPVGSRAFVTTFPCHYCARHLVAAGVDEVQYIEPYPKSLARRLHDDAITNKAVNWTPPSQGGDKVLFRPFTGVAPRMYRRVFLKERELKDRATGRLHIGDAAWAHAWHLGRTSYVELEARLASLEQV